jgi:chromosome segregation ATPase
MTETSTPYHSISSSPSKQITVLDVYDLAASINRDFEKLAEQNGKDSIQDLVGKVISALETLEALAKHNDSTNGEILDLQQAVSRLEQEKNLRQKSKANLERDVAELEENYRREIDELWAMVKSLQEENKNIKSRMRDDREEESPQEKNFLVKEEEFQRMVDLRKMSNHQKEQIKDLQKDVEHYCCEVENLQNSIEKLIRQNKELLRKNGSLQKQGRLLVQERAELLRRIQESEEDNIQLRRILAETSRACKDLETQQQQDRESDSSPRFTLSELREVLQEKNGLKAKVMELEEQLEGCRGMSSSNSESGDRRDHFDNFSLSLL